LIAEALIECSLNHLLRQSPGAAEALRRHAGCGVRFDLALAQYDFRIADDGCFSEAVVGTPDAVIRPTAALATVCRFLAATRCVMPNTAATPRFSPRSIAYSGN